MLRVAPRTQDPTFAPRRAIFDLFCSLLTQSSPRPLVETSLCLDRHPPEYTACPPTMSNAANHQPRRAGILEEDIQEELRDLEKAEREVDASAPDLKQIVKMLDGICALFHWYIRTISRTWSLLEGIWDGCNVSTRVAIDGIVTEKLLKVDKIASGRGNGKFRDLIKEMVSLSPPRLATRVIDLATRFDQLRHYRMYCIANSVAYTSGRRTAPR